MEERHFHEACGVFGITSPVRKSLAEAVYYGLYALQHRGQESAGIAVNDGGLFQARKAPGLVGDAFSAESLRALGEGQIAVGHVRYATTGSDCAENIQPLIVNHRRGSMALVHNGNLTNAYELRKALEENGAIFHTTTDSEVIAYVIVQERLQCSSIEAAISSAMEKIHGAYTLVISSPNKLIAARDPYGFRPLCYGEMQDGSIVFASESCALDAVQARFIRDVRPGEIIICENGKLTYDTTHCDRVRRRMCVFEYIYFARPDSVIDGAGVSLARQRAGAFLAEAHPVQADLVIGVPDSGLEAALGFSRRSGIPYAIGFTKNKYIGRTFIAPDQSLRENGVNIKLNPIADVVRDKRVVLVDDSIVRGTTSRHIVDLLRRAGAREIHMRISSPPFIAPCYYGTDVDSADGLIANRHSVEEIRALIGADSLGYLRREDVCRLTGRDDGFCTACFTAQYPVSPPNEKNKSKFERRIGETEADSPDVLNAERKQYD